MREGQPSPFEGVSFLEVIQSIYASIFVVNIVNDPTKHQKRMGKCTFFIPSNHMYSSKFSISITKKE